MDMGPRFTDPVARLRAACPQAAATSPLSQKLRWSAQGFFADFQVVFGSGRRRLARAAR